MPNNKMSISDKIIEETDDVIFAKDLEGRYLLLNAAAARYLKTSKSQALGKTNFDLMPPAKASVIKQKEAKAAAGEPCGYEETVKLDGRERLFLITVKPNRDDIGKVSGIIGIGRDITEAKIREELREKSEKLRALVSKAPLVLLAADKRGVIDTFTGKALKKLGLKWGENVGRSIYKVYRDNQKIVEAFRRSLAGEEATVMLGSTADNKRFLEATFTPRLDDKGVISGVIGVAIDVTKRKRAEESLRDSRRRLEEAQRIARLGDWVLDYDSRRVYASAEGWRLLGLEPQEEGVGLEFFYKYIHPDDRAQVKRVHREAVEEQKPYDIEYRVLLPGAIERVFHGRGRIEKTAGGELTLHGTSQDVTERRRKEELLHNLAIDFASLRGRDFFQQVAEHVLLTLSADFVLIAKLMSDDRLNIVSWTGVNKKTVAVDYGAAESACRLVTAERRSVVAVEEAAAEFPRDRLLTRLSIAGYVGVPLLNREGKLKGVIAALYKSPLKDKESIVAIMKIYSERITAEMERLDAEALIRQKDQEIKKAYADVFSAVTNEKLLILTPDEITEAEGRPLGETFVLNSSEQLAYARDFIKKKLGGLLKKDALEELILAVNEAMTNALKHGGSGELDIFNLDNRIQVRVADKGAGINFSDLPKATLSAGYSTKKSLGMGFSIILEVCDRVLLSTSREGTELLLERVLKKSR